MDKFSPAFWLVYVIMAVFLGFLAWEIIKMIVAVITVKYIKEDRKKKVLKRNKDSSQQYCAVYRIKIFSCKNNHYSCYCLYYLIFDI